MIAHSIRMERSRSDEIAANLESLIFQGAYKDGDRFDELRLAEQFGVSRTPIREALQKLAMSGLVEQIPRRGVFVRQPGPIELLEMFEMMAGLEALCGRLAATRISEKALEKLRAINATCQKAVAAKDPEGYYSQNEQFHWAIYRSTGNQFLEQECLRLYKRLSPFRRVQLQVRGRMKQSMAEHEAIVAALAEGDGNKVASLLNTHVAVQGEKFQSLIASLKQAAE